MSPGRELDALVAEKVMGLAKSTHPEMPAGEQWWTEDRVHFPLPTYSTDIAAAWEVVEKIAPTDDYRLAYRNGRWAAEFGSMIHPFAEGDTAPHAICLAALKAAGGAPQ